MRWDTICNSIDKCEVNVKWNEMRLSEDYIELLNQENWYRYFLEQC